ncbi:MAG: AAA family ATPase [Myxococcaceae bacterium]|nr:AAA family ATPase [Myxococcaceae bacterium]
MASLPFRFASASDFFRFWGEVQATRSFFVATPTTPDIGEPVEVELIVGAVRRLLPCEVESVELDASGTAGIRVGYGEAGASVLVAMRLSVNTPASAPASTLEEEPRTDPAAAPAGIPMKTVIDPTRARQDLTESPAQSGGVRIDEARPRSLTPQQPSTVTPNRVRIDAAPVAPTTAQSVGVAPPVRLDEARPQSLTPQQPSTVTPNRVRIDAAPVAPPVRLDEARPQSLTPQQPSTVTPNRVRIDAAQPSLPPPSIATREWPARNPVGPLVTAPPPAPVASAPPPPTPMALPSLSTLRPPGSTGSTPALTPGLAPSASPDGHVGRIGEQLSKLGFPLTVERIGRAERTRAALPATMPIAWLLGVEWVRASDVPSLSTIVTLTTDVCAHFGGVIDDISPTGARFVFFGLGSQGACVLAAQELRERVEALADGRPDAPSLKLAFVGSRLRAEPDSPVEGDGVNALGPLLRKAQPGQCLLTRSLAHGISDLLATAPVGDEVQLTSRRPSPLAPWPTLGLDALARLLELRVTALERGPVAPLVLAGARRSGRTHLAQEIARRAHGKAFVGFSTSLKSRAPLSSLAELVCSLCRVSWEERHAALGPALTSAGVAPIRREAMLAALQLVPAPTPFTTRQVVDALRLVLADLTQRRPRVLIFDGLDQADAETVEVVKVLLTAPAPGELVVCLTAPEQVAHLGVEAGPALPTFGATEVDALLVAAMGVAVPELRELLLQRSGGLPGLVVDLLLLTVARGAVRPRGESLTLEGSVPAFSPAELLSERLAAEGARCGRLLQAVWMLGDAAEPSSVAQVLPGIAQELWPRATTARLLVGSGGKAVVAPAFEGHVASLGLSGPGLAARVAALVQGLPQASTALTLRLAQALERAGDAQPAGQQFQKVAEAGVRARAFELLALGQEGMARVLRRHPQRDTGPVLTTRLQLWARGACARLALGDVAGARHALNEGLDAKPRLAPPEPELAWAHVRVSEAEGKADELAEALAEALSSSKTAPVRAAVLASLAQTLEARNDAAKAQDAWHQALAAADPFLPIAPWFGEVDFRGRVEARIGALFIVQQQPSRARTWLVSAAERFKAAHAPLYAARVMANLGALSMQLSNFQDAAQWFNQAAVTAETGGDFLFQARQLASLAKVLARQNDPKAREVAAVALGLAEALGWDDGAAALRALG